MTQKLISRMCLTLVTVAIALGLVTLAWAATGNIDPVDRWAWGTNVGWIDLADDNGGVTVYSDHLEGYAWSENIGWIRLGTHDGGSPHTYANDAAGTYGVNNDGVGNLSGYAWSTNMGWINFNPTNGGVTVDPVTGDFDGYARAENVGRIHFKGTAQDSTAYKVNTTWHGDLTSPYQNDIAALITGRREDPAPSAGLTIANSSFLNDSGDGIVFGHDDGSGTTGNDCPPGVSARWQRVWQFDVNDGTGTTGGLVHLTFDFSDAGIVGTPAGDYTLLKRSEQTGDFAGIACSSDVSDDQVTFHDVDVGILGSYFTLGEGSPTAVTLASFTADAANDDILLAWETVREVDIQGFHLYRQAAEGELVRLNAALIPSQNPGSPIGGSYEFVDAAVIPGVTYRYWLEAVDVHGAATRHGPVPASLPPGPTHTIYLPIVGW